MIHIRRTLLSRDTMIAASSIYECACSATSERTRSMHLADDCSPPGSTALHGTKDETQPGVPATFQVIFLVSADDSRSIKGFFADDCSYAFRFSRWAGNPRPLSHNLWSEELVRTSRQSTSKMYFRQFASNPSVPSVALL